MGCSAAIPCSARGLPRSVGAAQDRVQSGLHPEIAMRGQEFVHRNPASFIIVIVVNDDDPAGCEPPGRFIKAITHRIIPVAVDMGEGDPFDVQRRQGFLEQRSEERTSELQSLMRISYAVLCLKKKNINKKITQCKQHYLTI